MTDNIFDKFVSDKLRDHPSPVPPGLWEKIERKKDRDRGGAFWLPRAIIWAGLFVILAGLGVGHYLLQQGERTTPASAGQASAARTQDGGSSHQGQNTIPATVTKNGDQNKGAGNNAVASLNETPNTNNDQKAGRKIGAMSSPSGNRTQAAASTTSPDRNDQMDYGWMQNNNNKELPLTNSRKHGNKKAGGGFAVSHRQQTADIQPATGNNPVVSPDVQRIRYEKGVTLMNFANLKPLGKDKFDLSGIRLFGIDCPTTGKPRRNDWYLEVYGSPDKAFKTVSGSVAYVNKKDSTESTQLGYTAAFRISRSVTDNILVKTGLQFSQINERFDLRTENERRIITVVTIRPITLPNGTDSTIRDTTSVEQIGYTVRRTYNRYRSLDIPVLMSYEFGGDRLKFAVNAGVILNLRSWYSGESLNDSLAVVSLNSKNNSIYKQNIGLGIYAGFSILTPVAKHTELFFEPYFRYNLSNMSNGAFTQKFNASGLSVGLRYKLNGQRKPGY